MGSSSSSDVRRTRAHISEPANKMQEALSKGAAAAGPIATIAASTAFSCDDDDEDDDEDDDDGN